MIRHLYRFRPLRSLLGPEQGYADGFAELEKQTIYFAEPERLNDPIEGFKDVFWSGDQIVWENLFRNYLLCLERIFSLILISGNDYAVGASHISPDWTVEDFPSQALRDIHKQICARFFRCKPVKGYAAAMAGRINPVRANELALHLMRIHGSAVKCVHDVFVKHNISPKWQSFPFKSHDNLSAHAYCNQINELERVYPNNTSWAEKLFTLNQFTIDQLSLIGRYNSEACDQHKENFIFLIRDFPAAYVRALERIIHPDWYAVSFCENFNNSSLWGNYAENHSGICMKFRVKEKGDVIALPLNMITGFGGGRDGWKNFYGIVEQQFYEIKYAETYPTIDFFRSIGKLPIPRLNSNWFFSPDGRKSICHDALFNDQERWRKNYWEDFYTAITRKTNDWRYEEEYRLILHSDMTDYRQESRSITYEFNSLDGIIFGINTPMNKKLMVMKIMDQKCREAGRPDFKFYQAYYDKNSGRIEAAELRFLTPKYGSVTET